MPNTVGVIGVGLMGDAMSDRLLDRGFDVVGFDIDRARLDELESKGGRSASSIADLAAECACAIVSVLTIDQAEVVVAEELARAWTGLPAPKVAICVATCDPDRVVALAARIAPTGIAFLDAPVSGTSRQVRDGQGLGLIGGAREAVDAVAPVLEAVYQDYALVGQVGDGSRAKLAVNLILGLNRLALAEGLVFAERLGLDPAAFLDVARRSAAYSQIMDVKGGKMVASDFSPHGAVATSFKDAKIMLSEAHRRGQALPLGQVMADILEGCVRNGEGEWDNSAVIEEIRRRTIAT